MSKDSANFDWCKDSSNVGLALNPDYTPFNQEGGQEKFYQTFGDDYASILKEMHEVLVSV